MKTQKRDVISTRDDLTSVHFLSVQEFLEHELPKDHVNYDKWIGDTTRMTRGRGFYGPTNYGPKECINHALLGDEKLAKRLREMWSELDEATGKQTTDYRQSIKSVKRKRVRKEFGDELDIHKVYQGQLDTAWSTTERIVVDQKHSLITIFVDIGGNANIEAEDSLWRAVVATRLVAELEQAGKSVKVVVGAAVKNLLRGEGPSKQTVSVVVKQFNQPLSIERLAAMVHIGFYRAWGFGSKQVFPRWTISGYGQSVPVTTQIPVQLQEEVEEGHTRFVHIERATTVHSGIRELESAYRQMKKYSEEVSNG